MTQIDEISQTVSAIPPLMLTGEVVSIPEDEVAFVSAYETNNEHLVNNTVPELNALKAQFNTSVGQINTVAQEIQDIGENAINAITFNDIATLKLNSNMGRVDVLGYYSKGDGGGGTFYWDSASTESDNGGTIIQATGVTTGRWKRVNADYISTRQFGAKCDLITDDTLAIQKTFDSISTGTIIINKNSLVSSYFGADNISILIESKDNLNIIFEGRMTTNITSSGVSLFGFKNVNKIKILNADIEGLFSRTLSVINIDAPYAFKIFGVVGVSKNIVFENIKAKKMHSLLITQGTTYRIRNISINNAEIDTGYYGINMQNNGDNVVINNLYTKGVIRSYFIYGVYNHKIQYESDGGDVFTDCVIASMGFLNTSYIDVKALIKNNISTEATCKIEVQRNTSDSEVRINNINISIDDTYGTNTKSLAFSYWKDGIKQTTASYQLFNNIIISGKMKNDFSYEVTPDISCNIDFTKLDYTSIINPNTYNFIQKISSSVSESKSSGLIQKGLATNWGTFNFNDYSGINKGYFDGGIGLNKFLFKYTSANPLLFECSSVSAGTLIGEITDNSSVSKGFRIYAGLNTSDANTANSVVKIGTMSSTNRSINVAGTFNAGGADYAEYEYSNSITLAKGQIVGFKADGTLTNKFSESIRFAIKSTNPSYVGGDIWGDEKIVGKRPEQPVKSKEMTDKEFTILVEQYKLDLTNFEERLENERQKVDRIAYAGKVPVNVYDAIAGDYIIAVNKDDNIDGEAISNPTFEQYLKSIGRVNKILDDGRAEVAVIIH